MLASEPPAERVLTGRFWIASVLLTAAIAGAFWPAFSAGYVSWDDPDYLYFVWNKNAPHGVMDKSSSLLTRGAGLKEIWNPWSDHIQQFYPLVFSGYWIEHQLWGLDPLGYHAVNLAMHAINAALVLMLLRRLGVSFWIAALGAAIFALHPVQVASVVWVTERKNTLSGIFYLLAFLLYLRHRRTGGWGAYAGCLGMFIAGLLSKTQVVTLPVSLLLADMVLQRAQRVRFAPFWAKLARIAPMLALGIAASYITTVVEHGNNTKIARSKPDQRPFIAANTAWFYAGTFLAPVHLAPVYPLWEITTKSWKWWPALLAWLAAFAILLVFARRIGGLALFGAAHFFIALVPVLGFVPFNYQQYSLVADHYLYLSCIGGGLVLALLAGRAARSQNPPQAKRDPTDGPSPSRVRPAVAAFITILVLAGYVAQSFAETQHWHDSGTFWTRAKERSPECYPAHFNLATHYRRLGQVEPTIALFERASQLRLTGTEAFKGYIQSLMMVEGPQAVVDACTKRTEQTNRYPRAYLERAKALRMLGRIDEAIEDCRKAIRFSLRGSDTHREATAILNQLQRLPSTRPSR